MLYACVYARLILSCRYVCLFVVIKYLRLLLGDTASL